MKIAVYMTTCGNVAFAATFLKSYYFSTRRVISTYRQLFFVQDHASGNSFREFDRIFTDIPILQHRRRGGCNALWVQAVEHAYDNGYEVAIVANDDIMFPFPLATCWIDEMNELFRLNPHIAAAGIGSDSVWENEHRHRERWFTDPSLIADAADHCHDFKERSVKYVHHVSGPLWACRPKQWLEAGGIDKRFFWAFGEIQPCIELRKLGYQSVACQYPCTILHYGGGAFHDIHSNKERHESFVHRSAQLGNEGEIFAAKYGTGHVHLLAQAFDEKLPTMGLPPIQYDGKEWK